MSKKTQLAAVGNDVKSVQAHQTFTQTITRTLYGKEIDSKKEEGTVEVHKFVTEPAKISLSMGVTLNLGNYEAVRVDFGVTLPCYIEEKEQAEKYVTEWVERRIVEEIESARSSVRKRSE